MVCAQKGYPLVITMADSFLDRTWRRLMRFLGAKVITTPAALRATRHGAEERRSWPARPHGWFYTRQFENEANPDMHSRTTAREIIEDFAGHRLDYWVTGYGTGGTLKGVARVLKAERPDTQIVVCEPQDAPLLESGAAAGAQSGWLRRRRPPGLEAASDAGLDAGFHSQADRRRGRGAPDRPDRPHPRPGRDRHEQGTGPEGRHLRRHHRRRDPGRRAEGGRRTRRRDRRILCMLPDTGERYLSTALFADVGARHER